MIYSANHITTDITRNNIWVNLSHLHHYENIIYIHTHVAYVHWSEDGFYGLNFSSKLFITAHATGKVFTPKSKWAKWLSAPLKLTISIRRYILWRLNIPTISHVYPEFRIVCMYIIVIFKLCTYKYIFNCHNYSLYCMCNTS